MDRVGVSLMMTSLSYKAQIGRLSPGDIADARHRLGVELDGRDDEAGRGMLARYLDRLDAARGDPDAIDAVSRDLRKALTIWVRPDPVDADRRDIHG